MKMSQIPKEVKIILDKIAQKNHQIYIVGGAVRDLLMEREVTDWDFSTDATPEEILSIFPEGFYDNKFGTVGVPDLTGPVSSVSQVRPHSLRSLAVDAQDPSSLPPVQTIFEITTMRKEGDYSDHRHPEVVNWTKNIEEDLARRDFTINAMALKLHEKSEDESLNLIDPFSGQEDLTKRLIRTVGDPNQRFREDALRMMRAIRISTQLNFEIEPQTFASIGENKELIRQIASERVRDELFKILASPQTYSGILKLKEVGILGIILPELERCFGVVQEGPKHDRVYDIGEHSLLSLKECPTSDPLVKLAVLLHDIGKTETKKIEDDGNVTFYNHDIVGGHQVLQIAKRFNLSKAQTDKLFKLVRWHLFTVDENQTDSAIRRFIKNIGIENIEDMMALRVGDRLGGGTQNPTSWRMEKFQERIKQVLEKPFSITDLKVRGTDVMEILNIPPSRKVGEVLDKLFAEVLEDSSKNTKDYLIDRIKRLE